MDIAKLVPVIEELKNRFESKTKAAQATFGPLEVQVDNLIIQVLEYKKWSSQLASHSKDTALQKLPVEYYQACVRHTQQKYDSLVEFAIPRLLEIGLLDKDGKLL